MSWIKNIFSKKEAKPPESLKKGLNKTRQFWGSHISQLLFGKKTLDPELLETLETHLISADVGVSMTEALLADLTANLKKNALSQDEFVVDALKAECLVHLQAIEAPFEIPKTASPFLMLIVGVNGVGKTTTLAKLGYQLAQTGKKVLFAAGDTFRSAAIEQLQHWGEQYHIPVIAQQAGADSAAIIFDAYQSAKAKGFDVVLADTAGRLHTQTHLMDELKKIKRVLAKIDPALPHATWLVLDATIGQNAIQQLKEFHEAIGITGLVVTKLDGTAKGGIVLSLAQTFHIPLYYIGVGEAIEDLQPFDATTFVEAIFSHDSI